MMMMMIVWTTNSYCSAINGGIAATNTRVTIAFVSSNVFVCSFLLYHSSLIGHNILSTYLWMFSFDVHFHQFTPSHELSICLSTSFQSIWECVLTKLPTHSIFFFLIDAKYVPRQLVFISFFLLSIVLSFFPNDRLRTIAWFVCLLLLKWKLSNIDHQFELQI